MKSLIKIVSSFLVLSNMVACSTIKANSLVMEKNCEQVPKSKLRAYCYQQQAALGDIDAAAELVLHYRNAYRASPELADKYKAQVMASDNTKAKLIVLTRDEKEQRLELLEQRARKGDVDALEDLMDEVGIQSVDSWVLESNDVPLLLAVADEYRFSRKSRGTVFLEKAADLGSQEALDRLSHYDVFNLNEEDLMKHHKMLAERGSVASMLVFIRAGEKVDEWVKRAIQKDSIEQLQYLQDFLSEDENKNLDNIKKVNGALTDLGDLESVMIEVEKLDDRDSRKIVLYDLLQNDKNISSTLAQLDRKESYDIEGVYEDFLIYSINKGNYKLLKLALDKYIYFVYNNLSQFNIKDERAAVMVADHLAKIDQDTAIEFYQDLIVKDNRYAEFGLLNLYLDLGGDFIDRNRIKVNLLLDRMIASGDIQAMIVKAERFFSKEYDQGSKKEYEEAIYLLRKAYDKGYRPDDELLLFAYAFAYVGYQEASVDLQKEAKEFISMKAEEGSEKAQEILSNVDEIRKRVRESKHN